MFDADPDECANVFTKLATIDSRNVPGDEAFLFELAHPLGYGRLREPYGPSHLKLSHPSLLLQ
jgi:hypothetical protein